MIGRALLLTLTCTSLAHAAMFQVTNTNDDGAGSLRQAILGSNADLDPDANEITFTIGTGVQTILPLTPLPAVMQAVTIDGSTQPGYAGRPLIVIDGTNVAPGLSGLILSNHMGSTVKAIVINRFAADLSTGGNGLLLSGGGGHTIVGSRFGTDAAGTEARPNGRYGIACVGCTDCTIGGTDPAERNLLSGNSDAGLLLEGAVGNVIQGNWIGLNAFGVAALGNGNNGIFMLAGGSGSKNNTIGGDVPEAANVISGNGIGMTIGNSQTSGNVVKRNLIGTDASGTVAIGNDSYGIHINSAPGTTIDRNVIVGTGDAAINVVNLGSDGSVITRNAIGTDADGVAEMPNGVGIRVSFSASGAPQGATIGGVGAGNVIAHNGGAGIIVVSGFANVAMVDAAPTGIDIRENRIFANGGLAIDLEADGITPNDGNDTDDGANLRQNFPLITDTVDMGDTIEFDGTLDAAPNAQYRIELFECAEADPSGNGEAEGPLGTALVMTDENGHADLAISLPVAITPGAFITTTATDAAGNTSELSPVYTVPGGATTSSTSTSTSSSTSTSTSTTVTTTTGSPSSTVAPGSSSTSTTPAPATTTTTTAAACPAEPFPHLACDVATIQAAVASALGLDPIRAKLGARLGAAATSVEKARGACATAKLGPTKRALGKVKKALGQCTKTLRSRKARSVPEAIRSALGDLVAGAQSDVAIVKSGLACP